VLCCARPRVHRTAQGYRAGAPGREHDSQGRLALALPRQGQRGVTVSAETRRCWLHELGWGWRRAKPVAKDDAPPRVERLARRRCLDEPSHLGETLGFADARHIPWRPTAYKGRFV